MTARMAFPGSPQERAKSPEAVEVLPLFVPRAAEDDVLGVSDHSLEEVSPDESV
jgi:hypothetical protein